MIHFPGRASARQKEGSKHDNASPDVIKPRRSRLHRLLLWGAGLLVGLPVALISIVLIGVMVFVNIPYGQRVIERQTASLTGGMVQLEGVGGFIPSRLHIARVTLNDHLGPYLTVNDARLNWSPLALVHMTVRASLLQAQSLRFERLPVADPAAPTPAPASNKPSGLHFGVALARLDVRRIDLGKSLAGFPLSVSALGHLTLADLAPVLDGLKIDKLPKADLGLTLKRLDRPATIALDVSTPHDTLDLRLRVQDEAHGLVAQASKLDMLDPLALALDFHGPVRANEFGLSMRAGTVQADAKGTLDLLKHVGTLGVSASTPAMTPVAGVAWSGMTLKANLRGDLLAPSGDGALDIDALAASGAGLNHLALRFSGDDGQGPRAAKIRLTARADGVRAPGVPGGLLAQAPIEALLEAFPDREAQPFSLSVTHPLFQLSTTGMLKPDITGALDLVLPDLRPLAAIGKVDLTGHDVAHLDYTYRAAGESHVALRNKLAITGGMKTLVALLGDSTAINLDATVMSAPRAAQKITIAALHVDGRALHLHDEGSIQLGAQPSILNDLSLTLPDLKAAAPQVRGRVVLTAHGEGPLDDLAAKLQLRGEVGTAGVPSGPLTLDLALLHLPNAPEGTLHADGKLDGRALAIEAGFIRQKNGKAELDLRKLDWASLTGAGHLVLPAGATLPLGNLAIKAGDLNDFSALAGQRLGGRVLLDLKTSDPTPDTPPVLTMSLKGGVQAKQARIGTLDLSGTVRDPVDKPDLGLKLAVSNVVFQEMKGGATLSAHGTLDALALAAKGSFDHVLGAPATLDTALVLDLPGKTVRLDHLSALLKGETLRSAGASTISFGEKTAVDRLQVAVAPPGISPATLDVSGSIKPRLDIHLRVAHVTPALAKPFMPTLDAAGTLAAQADLSGDIARPAGTIAVTLSGLHMRSGPAESLPAFNMQANATLAGERAQIAAQADAGKRIGLRVAGSVPAGGTGNLDLKVNGALDLAVANAVLGAQGMALSGRSAIDLALGGALAAPSANGRVTLEGINFAHYGQGVRLTDINGTIVAANDTLALQDVVAHAGKGTIALTGSIGVLRPGLPLDIKVTSRKAQPVTSDLLTAVIDTDLRAHGQLSTRLDVDGTIGLPSVIVNIPSSMPASVPQLTVIRPGEKREAATRAMIVGLNMDVISPGNFFVRGHGLDAEMSGKLHIGGVSTAPDISGGFDLKRGFFNLAGVNLNFTKGRVAFDGSGVDHKLDPSLDFRADRNVQGTLASLVVGGYASEPKIDFTSQPSLPRDQVLAMLLFGSTTASLSPTQLASLAAAVAQITGGSSFDPLDKVRGFLGLDRLAVGGGSGVNNGGASLEAGKYVMKGVYVGAKQATSGSGTQAQVQVDLTKRLKLNTTVGTGGQITGFTTPENDPGSSVGLSYGFDY